MTKKKQTFIAIQVIIFIALIGYVGFDIGSEYIQKKETEIL